VSRIKFQPALLAMLLLAASCGPRHAKDHVAGPSGSTSEGCWAEKPCPHDPDGPLKCMTPDTLDPCGALGCYDYQLRCTDNADCHEGYACQPASPPPGPGSTGMCQPAACASDSDCGSPNLRCRAEGFCEHRPCTKSEECSGKCVAGTCWKKPGFCARDEPSTVP
jgi:hypothetical protein